MPSIIRVKTRWKGWQSNNASDGERGGNRPRKSRGTKQADSQGFTLRFGKFAGVKISDVPLDYIQWMAREQRAQWAIAEEARRRRLTSPSKKCSPSAGRKIADKLARREARAEHQRQRSANKLARMQSGIRIMGADHQRLLGEFHRAGGDSEACPFDCEGYHYEGPEMVTVGGRTVIVESEFPTSRRT
jgi:hypothetical protein